MRRVLLRTLGVLGVVAAVMAAVASLMLVYFLPDSGVPAEGELRVEGLEAPVRVSRDSLGVPHITAETARDAFLALGFVHAQDRFWQMEVLRRTARGALSELFGRGTLGPDRLARTLGLARAAEGESEGLSKRARTCLVAYSAGVNRYLEEIRARRATVPVELRWLDLEPEPWRSEDSLALLRLRAWILGRSLGTSLLLEKLTQEIGGLPSRDFFPVRPGEASPDLVGTYLRLGRTADAWARAVGLGARAGSLGFLVGVSRSESGLPLLANDPHVAFQLPPSFYVAHLETPDWEVAGATWPGMPVFWTGTNRHIAWGQVVLHASVSDLFDETLDPEDPYRYRRAGRWRSVERRIERIGVRGGSSQEIEILGTKHGPLLGSVHPEDPGARFLSLRWAGQATGSGVEALLRVQEARDWDEFRGALRRFPGPVSTFLYADRRGVIGTQVAGRLPVRATQTDFLSVPSECGYCGWQGFMRFEDLPHQVGAEIPWLVASGRPHDLSFPHRVAWLWSSGGGPERLRRLLSEGARLGLDDVLAIQRERYSARGVEVVHELLDGVDPPPGPGARVHRILLEWDGRTDVGSLGASVYHAFRQQLARRLLEARLDGDTAQEVTRASEPLPGVLIARFLDRRGPRGGRALVERALEETWSWLGVALSSNPSKWAWGRLHQLRLRHDFERLGGGVLGWLGRYLGRGPFPVPGDADSVWAMYHGTLPGPAIQVGPVFRFAVDLAALDHSWFGLAGGQSGHPGAAYYDDALRDWVRGRPRPLWRHPTDIAYQEAGVWELRPPSE